MKCMRAQTRPRFILSSEGVFGGMEFEPMLTPREKSSLPENVPRGGSNPRHCGQLAQALPTELFRPLKPRLNFRELPAFLAYMKHTSASAANSKQGACYRSYEFKSQTPLEFPGFLSVSLFVFRACYPGVSLGTPVLCSFACY